MISPLKNQQSNSQSRSLKEVIQAVDNNKDLEDYITSYHSKVPVQSSEPKYERNPVLNPQANMSMSNMTQMHQQQIRPPPQQPPLPQPLPNPQSTLISPVGQNSPGYGPPHLGHPAMAPPSGLPQGHQGQGPPSAHERSFSHGAMLNQPNMPPLQQQQQQNPNHRNSTQALPSSHQRYGNGAGSISQAGPPQLGALPFQSHPNPSPSPPRQPPFQQAESLRSVSPPSTVLAPAVPSGRPKQIFGITLSNLYERDGTAVAGVVHQCIQAVDLYGLALEGIYRLSGSATHIQKLKNMFDTGKC